MVYIQKLTIQNQCSQVHKTTDLVHRFELVFSGIQYLVNKEACIKYQKPFCPLLDVNIKDQSVQNPSTDAVRSSKYETKTKKCCDTIATGLTFSDKVMQ